MDAFAQVGGSVGQGDAGRASKRTATTAITAPEPSSMELTRMSAIDPALPVAQGLYDPRNDHDACGVGFVADLKNRKSHAIVQQGLQILCNLDHRGAVGADPKLGDGCGILVQIPHRFFVEECARIGISLPEARHYGIGHFFMPRDAAARRFALQLQLIVTDVVKEAHDTHHPVSSALYYEEQKAAAKKSARAFVDVRMPKYLGYFEKVLVRNPRGPANTSLKPC